MAVDTKKERDVLYAHFFRHPATIARYASLITGAPWTCGAHARDVWLADERDLALKVNSASWIATCTTRGAEILRKQANDPAIIHAVYHGVDTTKFPNVNRTISKRDGTESADPIQLLTVGRAVEKKGFEYLLDALAKLPAELHWRLRHIGPGKKITHLKRQAHKLGISNRIEFSGYLPSHTLAKEYRACDIFVLPSLVDQNGDMDGIPNSLAEAASQAACCITTDVSEIPRMFTDGNNALVVPERNSSKLATALEKAMQDPALRLKLGQAASRTINARFNHKILVQTLSGLFKSL